MLDVVFAQFRGVANGWRDEVKRRRLVSSVDAAADTMDYLATELLSMIETAEQSTLVLNPEEYASLNHTTPQTVTAWCRAGKIRAERTINGWRIPRDQPAPARRRQSA